jgi:thioredoxin 1
MASDKVLTLTQANFQQEVKDSDLPVLVDFWASWCGPCRMIAPVIDEIAEELDGKLKIGKVDVDSNQQLASEFSVRSIPTLLVFKNGHVVEQMVGAVTKGPLLAKLQNHI